MSFIEPRNLLDDRQYGFQSNHSTDNLMSYLTHKICHSIQGYGKSQLLSLDIAKAFDRVSHKVMLSKLVSFGLPPSLVARIRSYLTNRIKVVLDGVASQPFQIFAGVPQVAVLSPSLFFY